MGFAVILTPFAAIMFCVAFGAIIHLVRHRDFHFPMEWTPTMISLIGVAQTYSSVFFLAGGPTAFACGAFEILLSLGQALMISPCLSLCLSIKFSVFYSKTKVSVIEFLSVRKHSIAAILLLSLIPLVGLLVSYGAALPGTVEVIDRRKTGPMVYIRCSVRYAATLALCYDLLLIGVTTVVSFVASRAAKRHNVNRRLYLSLMSTAMCGMAIITLAACASVAYHMLRDGLAKNWHRYCCRDSLRLQSARHAHCYTPTQAVSHTSKCL